MNALRVTFCTASLCGALLVGCRPETGPIDFSGPVAEWADWGGAKGGGRYSPLTQITRENVGALEVAWTFHTGHLRGDGKYVVFQLSPLMVDGTLYVCTPYDELVALDPETGAQRWRFDPELDADEAYVINCRGVSTWREPGDVPATQACRRRIIMGTVDARLIEVDAATGRRCQDFGVNGEIDLRPGLGEVRKGDYGVTSPPLILGDRIITGAMVIDDTRVDVPGGAVRAFDVRSGALLWGWDPIPPDREPLPPGPDGTPRFARGTSNAWTALSGDAERDLVFVPTGNTSPDYYGGHRNGLDYYSSSVVALDGKTGRVVWHFQAVHHDLWDYDSPAQPTLFEFPSAGGALPALALPTKMGHLFLLNRETGEPLFPVEERSVPQEGAVEALSATQPFPTRPPPLHPARLTPDDAFGFTFWDRGKCREKIASLRSEGIFTPPSTQGSVHYPGMVGGQNWGSVSVDPVRQLLVTNLLRVATEVRLVPRAEFSAQFPGEQVSPPWEPQAGTPYGLYRIPLLSPWGAPCNPPPWGTLAGIDLATGEVKWDVVLGTTRNLAPWPFWFELGAPNLGGSLVTASGLTFIGATTDGYLRAFDTETGHELWRGVLAHSAHATPISYRVRPDSRQFVVIAAGGHQLLGTEVGDELVAFALP